jgi:hypothetical protein
MGPKPGNTICLLGSKDINLDAMADALHCRQAHAARFHSDHKDKLASQVP